MTTLATTLIVANRLFVVTVYFYTSMCRMRKWDSSCVVKTNARYTQQSFQLTLTIKTKKRNTLEQRICGTMESSRVCVYEKQNNIWLSLLTNTQTSVFMFLAVNRYWIAAKYTTQQFVWTRVCPIEHIYIDSIAGLPTTVNSTNTFFAVYTKKCRIQTKFMGKPIFK